MPASAVPAIRAIGSGASTLAGLGAAFLILAVLGVPMREGGAHFLLNVNIRVIHVEHLDDGLRLYLRLPMPYLVANLTGAPRADGTVEPAPYTVNRIEQGSLVHLLDLEALRRNPAGLGQLVTDGHRVVAEGQSLEAEVEGLRVLPALAQTPFATLEEARRSFAGPLYPPATEVGYVGDLVVEAMLRYRAGTAVYNYAIGSTLDPGLPDQHETANVVIDSLPGGEPLVFRIRGLMLEPVEVSRSALAAAVTFVGEGIRHILEGADHVLFVLCLTLGATGVANLLWRVTGFTLGHTVTLVVGFLGYVPSGAWFVPAVESGIALSIIYAGAVALAGSPGAATFAVTAFIGLLHGLGFSFVLHEILRLDSPNLWQSLLAFNLGVELGQVAIVVLAYVPLLMLARLHARAGAVSRWAVALPCIGIAALWAGDRLVSVVAAL